MSRSAGVVMKRVIKRAVLRAARKSHALRRAAAFIVAHTSNPEAKDTYEYLKKRFISNGAHHYIDESTRSQIISKFERIDLEVSIGTTPTDGLFLAEMLFNLEAEGPIIECGCYAGGSSAKLSIIAELLNRELVICDSFEGLPAVEGYYERDQHCRRSEQWVTDWTAGRYRARLEQVQGNIARYGEMSVCRFVRGWFNDALTDENLPSRVAFAFVDVDLANSARDCFLSIWPRLGDKGIYVTHDTAYIKVLQELYNPELWSDRFKAVPPILFGAGYGLCNDSPHVGYMVKGESLSSIYLKRLTIDK